MQNKFLFKTTLLFLITACMVLSDSTPNSKETSNHKLERRAAQKPGFFKTLFSVIYEQWVDTKDTFNSVSKMINENIVDDTRPSSASRNAKTEPPPINGSTEAPKLNRSELNRILRRNLKGLLRLYNLELSDALKTSYRNNKEWRKNVSSEVSKYL